ncbi:MAG: SpoIIE family protein phosphatase [Clostridia bacterium]|nr:SpoIIE family protein phosphatase [Clostridia bacterium]
MFGKGYRKILDAIPEGVFVFDEKMRVVYTNPSFRRSFSEQAKPKGSLKEVLACTQTGVCGEGEGCKYCAFFKAMQGTLESNREQTERIRRKVQHADRTDVLSVRVRALPVDDKRKLFLGLTDGTWETDKERDMLSAKQMQQRLLPAGKTAAGVSYEYMYLPCLEVGGDIPDVYELDGKAYGVLADVSGKGVSAGMLSAFVKAAFDRKQPSLSKALQGLSEKFVELNPDERSYITVAAVSIDKKSGNFAYSFAGHNVPILLKNKEGIHEIETPSSPISNWFDSPAYEEKTLPYEKGDLLVLLTDGVTECKNARREEFGIERVENVLMQSYNAQDFMGKLRAALSVFCGGKFTDDVTVIAFDL